MKNAKNAGAAYTLRRVSVIGAETKQKTKKK